jgi:hypothetical protein
MAVPIRPLSEINEQAIRVLSEEMGPADTARFISQFTTGYGNYTEERKKLFEGLTLEEVAREIRSQKGKNA